MTRTILLFLAVALVVAVAIVIVTRTPSGKTRANTITMPDGTRIKLIAAIKGGEPFTTEKPWHGFARKVLPLSFQGWIPQSSHITFGDTNSLCLVLVALDEDGTVLPNSSVHGVSWGETAAIDETGFRYERTGGYGSFDQKYFDLTLRAFPHRQSSFDFVFFGSTNQELGRLRIENPFRGPFPEWRPEPLPVTCTNGPVQLTLKSLSANGDARYHWVRMDTQLKSTDPRWQSARVSFWTFEDATGNHGQWISPRESAWKARTTVHRKRPEDFTAEERFSVPALDLPAAGRFEALGISTNLLGVTFNVIALAGAGSLHITNGVSLAMTTNALGRRQGNWSSWSSGGTKVETFNSEEARYLMHASGLADGDDIAYRLTGDDGWSELKFNLVNWNGSGSGRTYFISVNPPAPVKRVALEIFLNRGLHFEFVINPAEMKPLKNAQK